MQKIRLPENLGAEHGQLLFENGVLIAVLACLSDQTYGEDCGKWHVEATFSSKLTPGHVIADLNDWLESQDER